MQEAAFFFPFKLVFWHTPGVKEEASISCEESEASSASLSVLCGTQTRDRSGDNRAGGDSGVRGCEHARHRDGANYTGTQG